MKLYLFHQYGLFHQYRIILLDQQAATEIARPHTLLDTEENPLQRIKVTQLEVKDRIANMPK